MIVRNKKPFNLGVVFAISFLAVLFMIFAPIYSGQNGLQFADDSFNKLAKGSSYFIPKVLKSTDKLVGTPLSAVFKLDKAEDAGNAAKLFTAAGAQVEVKNEELRVKGDLGVILQSALKDADLMYKNDGKAVTEKYGYDESKVMKDWWLSLNRIEKGMKKEKKVAEAKTVSDVVKKGIEPGYNFYRINANSVTDHAGMLSGLLVFYVAYTMWWGYAIFYLFEGVGLTMKKAKVRKEA